MWPSEGFLAICPTLSLSQKPGRMAVVLCALHRGNPREMQSPSHAMVISGHIAATQVAPACPGLPSRREDFLPGSFLVPMCWAHEVGLDSV